VTDSGIQRQADVFGSSRQKQAGTARTGAEQAACDPNSSSKNLIIGDGALSDLFI
jgi:hypothetical protein